MIYIGKSDRSVRLRILDHANRLEFDVYVVKYVPSRQTRIVKKRS